jgi:hypothetical protein
LNYFQKLQKVNTTNFQALAAEFGGELFNSALQTEPPLPFYRVSLGKGMELFGFGFPLTVNRWQCTFWYLPEMRQTIPGFLKDSAVHVNKPLS